MVKNCIYIIFAGLILFTDLVSAQDVDGESQNKTINDEKNKLSQIKNEITDLEKKLDLKTEKEKESFEVLENYNKQSYLLNKLINNLRSEVKSKQKKINNKIGEIKSLEKQISILKKNYSKYITAIYKYGTTSELASIFDAESFQQAFMRYKYLSKFSEKREEDLNSLRTNIEKLKIAKESLEKEKLEKEQLALKKQKEENGLEAKLGKRKKILKSIRNDKEELGKALGAKEFAEAKIKQIIVKLIADALAEKEERKELALQGEELVNLNSDENIDNNYDLNFSTSGMSPFAELKGKLHWPISDGKIIREFGKNTNSELNTVTLNYGVDIKADSDLEVKAVAEGVVSIIDWIPGYGSVIIITHKGDYRTVYSHLSRLFVREGDKVKMGTVIARIGESLQGYILHFEIWDSRNNQDPEVWLVKK